VLRQRLRIELEVVLVLDVTAEREGVDGVQPQLGELSVDREGIHRNGAIDANAIHDPIRYTGQTRRFCHARPFMESKCSRTVVKPGRRPSRATRSRRDAESPSRRL